MGLRAALPYATFAHMASKPFKPNKCVKSVMDLSKIGTAASIIAKQSVKEISAKERPLIG